MEELKAYLCKNKKDRLIIAAAGVVFGAGGAAMLLRREGIFCAVVGAVLVLCCVILEYEALTAGVRERRKMEELESSGVLLRAAAEFASAESFAGDSIRLGSSFLFRRKNTKLLHYKDIRQLEVVTRSDETDHGSEVSVFATLTTGKDEKLCSVGGDSAEAYAIACRIQAHNPGIVVK